MAGVKHVVLVGHCGADCWMLSRTAADALPGVRVVGANDSRTLAELATPDSLLLVNRVLEGAFVTDSGVELIKLLSQGDKPPRMMLISDYTDAQAEAVAAGASRGFGKSQAHTRQAAELIREAAGTAQDEAG